VRGVRPNELLNERDMLLYTGPWFRRSSPGRGALVVYRLQQPPQGGMVVRPGFGLDRVVGLPGDHIDLRDGLLRVNGETPPPDLAPLGDLRPFPSMEFTAADGEYVILPSLLNWRVHGFDPRVAGTLLSQVSRVPEARVEGAVIWRVRPLRRMGSP
jgi:hypothetical protein